MKQKDKQSSIIIDKQISTNNKYAYLSKILPPHFCADKI